MIIIEKNTYGGIDWHDSEEHICYLTDNNAIFIEPERIVDLIVDDAIKAATDENGQKPDREKVYEAIRHNKKYEIGIDEAGKYVDNTVTKKDIYYETCVIFSRYCVEYEYYCGQVTYSTKYIVRKIESPSFLEGKLNMKVAIVENFYAPCKGTPCISRFYVEPFESYEAAAGALKEYKPMQKIGKLNEKGNSIVCENGKFFCHFDTTLVVLGDWVNSAWRVLNSRCIELARTRNPKERYMDVMKDLELLLQSDLLPDVNKDDILTKR